MCPSPVCTCTHVCADTRACVSLPLLVAPTCSASLTRDQTWLGGHLCLEAVVLPRRPGPGATRSSDTEHGPLGGVSLSGERRQARPQLPEIRNTTTVTGETGFLIKNRN